MNAERLALLRSAYRHALALTLLLAAVPLFGATLTVTNLADSGPGTLRDRIAAANAGDTLNFGVVGTITLNSELTIAKNLTIQGPGVQLLKVSGNNSTRVFHVTSGTVGINSMIIADGRVVGSNGPAGINGENVMGGGILVASGAVLGFSTVVISNNAVVGGTGGSQNQLGASGNGGNGFGGGIANLGSLTLTAANLVNNTASGGAGGTVTDGDSPGAGGQGWGGGLYSEGSATLTLVTVGGNQAAAGTGLGGPGGGSGGGIYNVGSLGIVVATIASNSAAGSSFDFGGGIENYGTLNIVDATIAGNSADYGGGLSGGGTLANTILALNSATVGGPDGSGSIASADFNFIQNTNGLTISGNTSRNITGQNPLLTPLQNNGGGGFGFIMPTMMPLPGSPVIDKGNSLNSDQLSRSRPYDGTIPNAAGGNGADIGAVEVHPGTLLVVNTNNSGAGSLRQAILDNNGLGGGNTITFSNTVTGTITLNVELTVNAPARIHGPGSELLSVSGNHSSRVFTILQGPTEISGLTLRHGLVTGSPGNQGQNGFEARGGGIFNQSALTLSNCVVLSNQVVGGMGGVRHLGSVGRGGIGYGGGVYNAAGHLSLVNCVFDGNRATGGQGGGAANGDAGEAGNGLGGAVCTIAGTNEIRSSTFRNNVAQGGPGGNSSGNGSGGIGGQGYGAALYSESDVRISNSTLHHGSAVGGVGGAGSSSGGGGSGYGGAIYNVTDLALHSATIANNSANGSSFDFGGGIYNVGTLGLTNSTIAGNQADFGGGLHGDATAANTILAGNTAGSGADVSGTINSFDYNLVQSFAGLNIVGATTHVIIGQDPMLGPLQDNGGPTLTMALLPGSPAIDQGRSFGAIRDQRGAPRPYNLPSIADAGGGDSSDIGAFEFLPTPLLSIHRAPNDNVVLSWSTDAADYFLESATNLPAPANWIQVTSPRTYIGNQAFVTNTAAGARQYYRLRFPWATLPGS